MDNKKFSKDLFDRIKKEDIKQTPKYVFVFKSTIVWFLLLFSIVLWALSLSISFDYLLDADWYLFKRAWLIRILFVFLPLFWIFFLVVSSISSYYNYRHTNKGYKLSLLKVFTLNILSALILAVILYFTWTNSYIESKIEKYVPKYRSILVDDKISRMIKVWQNEEKWLLIWEISEVYENKLVLKDYNNKKWNIILSSETVTDIKHRVVIAPWEKIKIIWEKLNENDFKATELRPFMWKGR